MKIASLILISIFLIAGSGYAHPPSDIEASYDKDKNVLTINITHPVRNPEKHFVDNVKISKNGGIISDETFTSQTTNNVQSIEIESLNLKSGDEITVEAECNIHGKTKKSISL